LYTLSYSVFIQPKDHYNICSRRLSPRFLRHELLSNTTDAHSVTKLHDDANRCYGSLSW